MKNERHEFYESVKKTLYERAGNHCSNPNCRRLTSGPNNNPAKSTKIGVAAHITAAAKNGPRYDSFLNKEERKSIFNRIWLCCNCAKLIDSNIEKYPSTLLLKWKAYSEELAYTEMLGKELKPEQLFDGYKCPFCDTFCKDGVVVCVGCQSDIYYGSTPYQYRQDTISGRILGLIIGFIILMIPNMINFIFRTTFALYWGKNILVVIAFTVYLLFILGELNATNQNSKRKILNPRFVRNK